MRSCVGDIFPLSFFLREEVFLVVVCDFDEVAFFDDADLVVDVCVCAESACANNAVANATASIDTLRNMTLMSERSPDELGESRRNQTPPLFNRPTYEPPLSGLQ